MYQYYVSKPQAVDSRIGSRISTPSYWENRFSRTMDSCGTSASRPLPPRPPRFRGSPHQTTIPLKIWIIASGFCFTTCAALVLATVIITRWDHIDPFAGKEMINTVTHISSWKKDGKPYTTTATSMTTSPTPPTPDYSVLLNKIDNTSSKPVPNTNTESKKFDNLMSKLQIHPVQEEIVHPQRNTKKKDKAIDMEMSEEEEDDLESQEDFEKWTIENFLSKEENLLLNERNVNVYPKFKPLAPFLYPAMFTTEASTEKSAAFRSKLSAQDTTKTDNIKTDITKTDITTTDHSTKINNENVKPTKTDALPYEFFGKEDYFYNDDNIYEDYMQSNTMTSYLLEKVQEVHDWVTSDPDFNNNYTSSGQEDREPQSSASRSRRRVQQSSSVPTVSFEGSTPSSGEASIVFCINCQLGLKRTAGLAGDCVELRCVVPYPLNSDFASVLKALNETIIEGNLTIVMTKLKDLYFGDNYTHYNHSRTPIVKNNTDLLSFGILTLDVILLHNIQAMAWEYQESAKIRMLRDPNVFAFNALFSDPSKLEQMQNNKGGSLLLRRLGAHFDEIDYGDLTKNLFENILEASMSTARAAIHLGKAYKSTKLLIQHSQQNKTVQSLISRNLDSNSKALNHLQNSYDNNNIHNSSFSNNGSFFTELDCIWLLYCRNLEVTSKLSPPYGTMARINGIALRILTGELQPDHALDTITYEVLTGWSDLHCNEMFPRCSKANASAIVIESILQGHRKTSAKIKNR